MRHFFLPRPRKSIFSCFSSLVLEENNFTVNARRSHEREST
ncbi:hypothetical protein HMPREF1862_00282 [Varibaculum cambriense]|uniref:Uncharacterized protein n=1 Tax=Varibaculum cambriense TaxID=184870 RepID=A0AB34X205_9ACTO|nr:hypothetical protein HMPREF1862_00282 [Varibaculum cambriense]